jgi:hypothetical protein
MAMSDSVAKPLKISRDFFEKKNSAKFSDDDYAQAAMCQVVHLDQ